MNYLNHKTWLNDRKKYIGASDIPVLCQDNERFSETTPLDLYMEKRGEKEREISEELQNLFDAGHDQENIAIYRFLKKHDHDIAQKTQIKHLQKKNMPKNGHVHIFTEFKKDCMIAHPDMIWKKKNIEIKFVRYKSDGWNFYYTKEGKEYGTGEDIPFKYWLQCQFQMMLSGTKETILCANVQGSDFYYFRFNAEKTVFPILQKKASDFMNLVKSGTPPMPITRNDNKILFPDKNYKAMTLPVDTPEDKEFLLMIQLQKDEYKNIGKRIKNLSERKEKIKSNIMSIMTDYNVLYDNEGSKLASISEYETERVKTLNQVKKEMPEKYKRIKSYFEKYGLIKKSNTVRLSF